jgi:transcription elongation factor Elf1
MKIFRIQCPFCKKSRLSEVFKLNNKPKYRLCYYCNKKFNMKKAIIKELVVR